MITSSVVYSCILLLAAGAFSATEIQVEVVKKGATPLQAAPIKARSLRSSVDPGVDEDYGYPATVGGFIIEYPFEYSGGPAVWPSNDGWGAFGLITAAPEGVKKSSDCPPIPADSALKPLEGDVLNAFSINQYFPGQGIDFCMLSCNTTEVSQSGVDPCNAASITDPSMNTMSCFDIGGMAPPGMGVCGYNCSALMADVVPATPCDDIGDNCLIYCDTSGFPGA